MQSCLTCRHLDARPIRIYSRRLVNLDVVEMAADHQLPVPVVLVGDGVDDEQNGLLVDGSNPLDNLTTEQASK